MLDVRVSVEPRSAATFMNRAFLPGWPWTKLVIVRPESSSVVVPYSAYMPSTACSMPRPAMAIAASGTRKPTPLVADSAEAFATLAELTMALMPYLRPRASAMLSPVIAAFAVLASRRSP